MTKGNRSPDHDDRSVQEILEKIKAAETLLAEARSMLQKGELSTSETGKGSPTGSSSGETTPTPVAATAASPAIDPETGLDLNILRYYEPPSPGEACRATIIGLFKLVLEPPDADHLQECLRRFMFSELAASPNSLRNLMRFGWTRFKKFHGQYLAKEDDPASFQIVRTQPEDASESDLIKVFLYAQGRSPAPVELRRDPAVDGAWRIASLSL